MGTDDLEDEIAELRRQERAAAAQQQRLTAAQAAIDEAAARERRTLLPVLDEAVTRLRGGYAETLLVTWAGHPSDPAT